MIFTIDNSTFSCPRGNSSTTINFQIDGSDHLAFLHFSLYLVWFCLLAAENGVTSSSPGTRPRATCHVSPGTWRHSRDTRGYLSAGTWQRNTIRSSAREMRKSRNTTFILKRSPQYCSPILTLIFTSSGTFVCRCYQKQKILNLHLLEILWTISLCPAAARRLRPNLFLEIYLAKVFFWKYFCWFF